jgi:hypothetical protein
MCTVSPNDESPYGDEIEKKISAASGLRYNEGKIRYDLVSPIALHYVALVWTMGSKKYTRDIICDISDFLKLLAEDIYSCHNAQSVEIKYIAGDFVEVITNVPLEKAIQNMPNDRGKTAESGIERTKNAKQSQIKLIELGLQEKNWINETAESQLLCKEGSQNPLTRDFLQDIMGSVRFVNGNLNWSAPCILIMTIKLENQEVFYAVDATTALECLKNLVTCCRKHSLTFKVRQQDSLSINDGGQLVLRISGDRNWEKGLSFCECFACAFRHMMKWFRGHDIDKESGLPHLAHAAWNLMAILHLSFTKPEFDDRINLTAYPFPEKWEPPCQ